MDAQDILFNKALGAVLRKYRKKKGLSVQEAEQMIGGIHMVRYAIVVRYIENSH